LLRRTAVRFHHRERGARQLLLEVDGLVRRGRVAGGTPPAADNGRRRSYGPPV